MSVLPRVVPAYLTRVGLAGAPVARLAGDASDRSYFRVARPDASSIVLAVHRGPFDPASLPFVNAAALFAAMPAPVPRILDQAGDLGILAVEDLGDVTLQAHAASAAAAERAALYREAVSLIDVFQRRGRDLADERFQAFTTVLDQQKLAWELDFFRIHFLEGHRHASFDPGVREALGVEFSALADDLASGPRVLCHRDYHSRNLMVRDGRLAIIDFQDARLGPDTYDLASLLRDAYIDVDDAALEASIEQFLSTAGRREETGVFRARFDRMVLQRTLKALGTFGYQATVGSNTTYLEYVPRTLGYVRQALSVTDRSGRLTEILAQVLPEVA